MDAIFKITLCPLCRCGRRGRHCNLPAPDMGLSVPVLIPARQQEKLSERTYTAIGEPSPAASRAAKRGHGADLLFCQYCRIISWTFAKHVGQYVCVSASSAGFTP